MPYKDPEKQKRYKADYYRKNRKKLLDCSSKHYAKNPDKYHDSVLRHLYGIGKPEYDRMYIAQNGLCAVCQSPPSGKFRLAVDHDHVTGKVRALLCMNCNAALGMVHDNLDTLISMVSYLKQHKDN